MALVDTELKDKLIMSIRNIRDNSAQNAMWNTIKEYVTNNMELKGLYSGMIPGSPPVPDPANGEYTWNVLAIQGQPIINIANFSAWLSALQLNFTGATFQPKSNDLAETVTATTPAIVLPPISLSQDQGRGDNNGFENQMGRLASAIVDGLTESIIVAPTVGTATSINGGIGTVAFSNCI